MLSLLRGSSSLIAVPVSSKSVPVGAGSMALLRRVVRSGFGNSRFRLTKYRAFNVHSISGASSQSSRFDYRQISQLVKPNGKRAFLVDTLMLLADLFHPQFGSLRSLEAQGVPSQQAEAITSVITEVLNDSLENVAHSFVSKAEMQKTEMVQQSNLSKFKSKVQSSQEIHALRGQLEAANYDVIEYCIGTLVSISAVGLAVVHILM